MRLRYVARFAIAVACLVALSPPLRAAETTAPVPQLPLAHSLPVVAATRLPGLDLIASGAEDGRVKVWEASTGLLVSEYQIPEGTAVAGLAAHPRQRGWIAVGSLKKDQNPVAIVGGPATIRLVDLANNRVVRTFSGQAGRLTFSPQGHWLASTAYSLVSLWDTATGQLQFTLRVGSGTEAAVFTDEKTLVYRRETQVVFLDIATGATRTLTTGAKGPIAISKDGSYLAEVGESELNVWRLSDQIKLVTRPLMVSPKFIAFTEDGSIVAGDHFNAMFAGSAMNLVYRLKPGDWTLETFTAGHTPLSLVADGGDTILMGERDGRLQRIDAKGRVRREDLGMEAGAVSALSFSPDGRYLVAGLSGGGAVVWEPTSNWYRVLDPQKVVDTLPEPAFSDVNNQRHVSATFRTGEGVTNANETDREAITGLTFLGPESLLIAHKSGKAEVLNVTSGAILKSLDVPANPRAVVGGNARIAVIVGFGHIVLLNARTFEMRKIDLRDLAPTSAAINRAGDRVIVRGLNGTWELDAVTGTVITRSDLREGVPIYGADGSAQSLGWSNPPGAGDVRDGAYNLAVWRADLGLGVMAETGGAARIWSQKAGRFVATDFQIGGAITALVLNPNGATVLLGSGHGRIAVYDVATGGALLDLVTYDRRGWLARATAGYFDGSYAAWGSLRGSRPDARLDPVRPFAMFDTWYRPQLLGAILANQPLQVATTPAARPGRPPAVRIVSPASNYVREAAPPFSTTLRTNSETRKNDKGELVSWEVMAVNPMNSQVVGQQVFVQSTSKLSAEVEDQGGGLDECRAFRNRRLLGSVAPRLGPDHKAAFGIQMPVLDGDNLLSVYCFSASGQRSDEAELHIFGAETLRQARTAHVLTIGIDKYASRGLHFARADAILAREKLEAVLASTGSYAHIDAASLLDEQATAAEILRALRILAGSELAPASGPLAGLKAAAPSDAVFIHFAGHGGGFGGDYRLVAVDGRVGEETPAGTVSASQIRDALAPLQADRAVLIIDACESGKALDQVDARAGPLAGRSLAQLAYDKAMFVISASQSEGSALELQRLGHGLFSYVLFDKALGSEADENKDGFVSIREWLSYAQTQTPREQQAEADKPRAGKPASVRAKRSARSTYADETLNRAQTPRVFIPDPTLAREFVITQIGAKP
jgi:WD40 repeat protein